MTKTKTIHHEHGTTEVEIVECSSCGEQTPKTEAHEFIIKGQKEVGSIAHAGVGSHGWACEYCVETQISFPVILGEFWNRAMKYKLEFILVSIFWFALGILAGVSIP